MTKRHSRETKIYMDGYDLSGDGSALTLPRPRDLIEATAFGDAGEKNIVGPTRGAFSIDTLFDDTSGMDAAYDAWLTEQIASFWPAGDALGAIGVGSPTSILEGHPYTSRVAEIVRGAAQGRMNFSQYRLKSFATKATYTSITSTTVIDDLAASSAGGAFFVHGTAVSATGGNARVDVRLRDSADGTTFATVQQLTFTNAAGADAQHVLFAGALRQYVRLQVEKDSTTFSMTLQASYARL